MQILLYGDGCYIDWSHHDTRARPELGTQEWHFNIFACEAEIRIWTYITYARNKRLRLTAIIMMTIIIIVGNKNSHCDDMPTYTRWQCPAHDIITYIKCVWYYNIIIILYRQQYKFYLSYVYEAEWHFNRTNVIAIDCELRQRRRRSGIY